MNTFFDILELIAMCVGGLLVLGLVIAFVVAAIAPPLAMAYMIIKLALML